MDNNAVKETICQLELSILDPTNRRSVEYLNNLIADDFTEFGSSGTIYNKQDILSALPIEELRKFVINEFKIKELSRDAVLATYIVREDNSASLRSSIWRRSVNNSWLLIFHQGTKIY